ncbi:hypothetical protein MRX96_017945 [Rhipicephalus microplus]
MKKKFGPGGHLGHKRTGKCEEGKDEARVFAREEPLLEEGGSGRLCTEAKKDFAPSTPQNLTTLAYHSLREHRWSDALSAASWKSSDARLASVGCMEVNRPRV